MTNPVLVSPRLWAVCALAALTACSDNGNRPPGCQLAGYPETVSVVSVELIERSQLTLDGNGTRCEQIVRALLSPDRPPELARLDTRGATGTCQHDDILDREIVRLRASEYAGVPVFRPVQAVLVHVDAGNKVVHLAGSFLPPGHAPAAGCLEGPALAARVPGRPLEYMKFARCVPMGSGMYTIARDDVIEVGAEGVYLDAEDGLRRVRAIDVYLTPSHVDRELINSDAFCCTTTSLERCVGKRLFLDALTGEVVGQEPHCLTC